MRKGPMLILLAGILAAVLTWGKSASVEAGQPIGTKESILEFGKGQLLEDSSAAWKWYGGAGEAWADESGLEVAGAKLAKELGLAAGGTLESGEGHRMYAVAEQAAASGIKTTFWLVESGAEGTRSLVLKLEGTGGQLEELALAKKRLGDRLELLGAVGDWTAMIRGSWKANDPADAQAAVQLLVNQAAGSLGAKAINRYREGNSASVSFEVAGESMQAAVHKHSESGIWQLSVGTPLLTGEF